MYKILISAKKLFLRLGAGLIFSLALALPSMAAYDKFQKEFSLLKTETSLSFIWASDLHYRGGNMYNHGVTPSKLKAIAEAAYNADFLALTGDLIHGNDPLPRLKKDLTEISALLEKCPVPVFALMGNHDDGSLYARKKKSHILLDQSVFFRKLNMSGEGWYYRDFPKSKIRVICLNSSDVPRDGKYYPIEFYAFRQNQLKWLAEEALNIREPDWGCVILSHISPYHQSKHEARGFDSLKKILSAFRKGEKIVLKDDTPDFEINLTADFSSLPSHEVTALFSGHIHKSTIFVSENNVRITETAAYKNDFKGITIDRQQRRIFLTDKKGKTEIITY